MPIPTPEERIGTALADKYRLDAIIGRGGAGVLYRATHRWTGREVAVKMLHSTPTGEVSKAGRLLSEARAAAGLKHPNVVEVLDADIDDGSPYVVLELLSGRSLGEELKVRERLSAPLALRWLLPIIGAVAKAHQRGILHRDIKLDNIFLAQDAAGELRVKLLDFGLARPVDNNSYMTDSGMIVGTPAFMSPEQARAEGKVGPPADVWALGVVLYVALSGKLPFQAESTTGVLVKIVTSPAPRLSDVCADIPHNLAHAIDRALQRDLSLRYATVREFARAILVASVRDGIELPAAPDPIGLPEWQAWLLEEHNPGSTISVEQLATTLTPSAAVQTHRSESKSAVSNRKPIVWLASSATLIGLGIFIASRVQDSDSPPPTPSVTVAAPASAAPELAETPARATPPPTSPATPDEQILDASKPVVPPSPKLTLPKRPAARPPKPAPTPSAAPPPSGSDEPQIVPNWP